MRKFKLDYQKNSFNLVMDCLMKHVICMKKTDPKHILGVIIFLLALVVLPQRARSVSKGCYIEKHENRITLGNDSFCWQVDLSDGIRADYIENKLTNKKINLGKGSETGLRFSETLNRIELLDWKQAAGGIAAESADKEKGFAEGFHNSDYDDNEWQKTESPWVLSYGPGGVPPLPNPEGYNWFRVKFDLPDVTGQPITVGLGGCGIYDFGQQRFFINGKNFGSREVKGDTWQDPSIITINPSDAAYEVLRFGQTNVLSVQAWNRTRCRPEKLEELDPTRHWDMARILMLQDQFITVGPAYQDLMVTGMKDMKIVSDSKEQGYVVLQLITTPSLGNLSLHYEWTADEPILRKWLEFTNESGQELLLLDVQLGDYSITVPSSEGFRGYPVHVDNQLFMSIAHPSGVAQGGADRVRLRLFPGKYIQAGDKFVSKQAVYGMALHDGRYREAFWDYLLRRSMRREIEGINSTLHYDGLAAAWGRPSPWGDVDPPSEKVCLSIMDKMKELQQQYNLKFDFFWLDAGWWEFEKRSEMIDFSYSGFPNGPAKTIQTAKELGMRFGVWTSRGSGDCTVDPRAHQIYKNAIKHHIEKNGVTGFKFDGQQPRCWRKDHAEQKLHLPGKYSTEAFQDANIEIYTYIRELCPNVWIFGYWGHDSPWWLMYVSTTFDSGINAEMQTPSQFPALYDRDRKMTAMDQLEQFRDDMPPCGRDSLGVWTSEGWAPFGHERWRENLLIDVCRGPALFHLWSDIRKFNEDDFVLMSRVRQMMKSSPECFQNSKPIVGDPWKNEPYGYACSDGGQAFIVLYNPLFVDKCLEIKLDESIGLIQDDHYVLYRHYPHSAQMFSQPKDKGTAQGVIGLGDATVGPDRKTFWKKGEKVTFYIRPTEVLFFEIAPSRNGSVLKEVNWPEGRLPEQPYSPEAREISHMVFKDAGSNIVHIKGHIEACPTESTLLLLVKGFKNGQETDIHTVFFRLDGNVGKTGIGSFVQDPTGAEVMTTLERAGQSERGPKGYSAFPNVSYGKWLIFEIPLPSSTSSQLMDIYLTENISNDVNTQYRLFYVPMKLERQL